MKKSDQYHKWVEWSEEDQVYVGKCPDLITGIHGEDPVRALRRALPDRGGGCGTLRVLGQDAADAHDPSDAGAGLRSGRPLVELERYQEIVSAFNNRMAANAPLIGDCALLPYPKRTILYAIKFVLEDYEKRLEVATDSRLMENYRSSVEANRRPAAPLEAGNHFGSTHRRATRSAGGGRSPRALIWLTKCQRTKDFFPPIFFFEVTRH